MKTLKELLLKLPDGSEACEDARIFANNKTIEKVVKEVQRGDWLLWLAKKLDIPIKPLTLAKARCAKTVIHLMKDQRSIDAVNIAEKFGLGECTLNKLLLAANDATNAAAADTAYAVYAAYANTAAVYAAYANTAYANAATAYATASAAAYAAYAAADITYAAYAATAAADSAAVTSNVAYVKNQLQTANICREILGQLIIDKVNLLLTN